MLYLYAVTDRPEVPLLEEIGQTGPDGCDAPPYGLAFRDIAAVIGRFAAAAVPPTESNLWRHEAVLEALMIDRAVLPVRFGTVLPDEEAVRALLSARYPDFAAGLRRVRGRVELGLRVLDASEVESRHSEVMSQPASSGGPEARGRAYLLARLEEARREEARRQQAEALAAAIHGSLARLAVASTPPRRITPRLLLTAAYLVERNQMGAFRQEVECLITVHPGLRFLCTGPWPPYNFVERVPSDARPVTGGGSRVTRRRSQLGE